jgi:hypothetical protein
MYFNLVYGTDFLLFRYNFHLDWPYFDSTLAGKLTPHSVIALCVIGLSLSLNRNRNRNTVLLCLLLSTFFLYCCYCCCQHPAALPVPVETYGEDHEDESSEAILGLEPLHLTELQVARRSLLALEDVNLDILRMHAASEAENLALLRMHAASEAENLALKTQNLMLSRTLGLSSFEFENHRIRS